MRDYYEVLELGRDALADQIKTNYRRLAMKWHPDRNSGSTEAEERFKLISEAYATLSDPAKRSQYDAYLEGGASAAAYGANPYGDDPYGANPFDPSSPFGQTGAYGQAGGQEQGFAGDYFFFRQGQARRPAEDFGFGQGFAGFKGFTAEEAADLFTREMYALATELTLQNVGWRDIAAELERRGCPAEVAADIARRIEKRRKEVVRGNARPYFVRSAVSGFFGLCLVGLFGGMGFGILGLLGLVMFLSGGYNLLRAFYFITTGNAPRSLP